MNLNEALKELSENGYMVESKQYDIGTIIDTVFKDEEFKPTNDKNEFIGTPMSEYDVEVHYKYEPSSDTCM